jgi:hypothetical protein
MDVENIHPATTFMVPDCWWSCEIAEGLRENRDWIGKQERAITDGSRMSALARFKKSVTIVMPFSSHSPLL